MEWLIKILQGAVITDGQIDVDTLQKSISTEMAKHTIPKDVYNTVKGKLDTANNALDGYKTVDIDTLQKDLQAEKDGRAKDRKDFAVRNELSKAGAKDVDYLMYKLGDGVEFDEDGKIKETDKFISKVKEDYKDMFSVTNQTQSFQVGGNNNNQNGNAEVEKLASIFGNTTN